jgi:replicative DNA helicase
MVVIATAQLNRGAASNELPSLTHLKDSDSLSHDADIVLMIQRVGTTDNCKIKIEKSRFGGGTGSVVNCKFLFETRTLVEEDRDDFFRRIVP